MGQERVKDQLAVFIEAAKARGEALDHVLLAGPPGLGKTSLAQIVASELGRRVRRHRRAGARAQGRRGQLPHGARAAQRLLRRRDPPPPARARGDLLPGDGGPPAADHRRPGRGGEGGHARPARLHDDRRHHPHRPPHHAAARPLRRHAPARALRAGGPRQDRHALGRHPRRARSTTPARRRSPSAPAAPRAWPTGCSSARATTRRCAGPGTSTPSVAREALDLLEVDAAGLDRLDREILTVICEKFGGGPVGLSTLAVAVGEEADTIEDVYEPYLLQQGFLMRTPRGRVATDARVRAPRARAFAASRARRPAAASSDGSGLQGPY